MFVEESDACFISRDANGQAVAYVYFEVRPADAQRRSWLTRDEARRMGHIAPGSIRRLFRLSVDRPGATEQNGDIPGRVLSGLPCSLGFGRRSIQGNLRGDLG